MFLQTVSLRISEIEAGRSHVFLIHDYSSAVGLVRFAETSRPALSVSALAASEDARLVRHRSRR
jgi:hypothetical protein